MNKETPVPVFVFLIMAYPHTTYASSSPYSLYTDLPMDGVMDPEIKRSVSPTSTTGPWSVQRYLTDKHKSPFVVYPMMDSIVPGAVSPFPQAQFHRDGSPSYTNPPSTCSSALSPARDTDYCQARSPPTSSDAQFMSPYERPYEGLPQLYEFTGLADGCVNLGDVHPIQDSCVSYYEESLQHFDMPTRTCSMSSDCSNINSSEAWNNNEPLPLPTDLNSEISVVKTEICIPDPVDLCHPEVDDAECANNPGGPYMKAESVENDRENVKHGPHEKLEVELPKLSRNSKNHKRRSDSTSSSETKRAKVMAEQSMVRSGAKPSIQGNKGQYTCPECPKVSFKDQTSLDNHVRKQHTRPFTCIFKFAGCHSTFANKNEWKRHCASQHIGLQYWVCQQDSCAQHSNKLNTSKKSLGAVRRRSGLPCSPIEEPSALPNGSIFNRKDLYTQHLRRMHVPAHLKKQVKSKKHVPEWDAQQRVHQAEAIRTRCQLPTHMSCPAPGCTMRFDGSTAWDDRMEHVAKHLEKAAAGLEPQVQFGGDNDGTLVDWATSPAIGILRKGDKGRWVLQNPLKCSESPADSVVDDDDDDNDDEDADAEGEEVEY